MCMIIAFIILIDDISLYRDNWQNLSQRSETPAIAKGNEHELEYIQSSHHAMNITCTLNHV